MLFLEIKNTVASNWKADAFESPPTLTLLGPLDCQVQAIFSERKDDLNLALDEMKEMVTNLMNAPGKADRAFHPFPVRVLKGEKAMEGHEVPTTTG